MSHLQLRFQEATKSTTATLMAQRVVFWVLKTKAGVDIDGTRWVVNSLAQWMADTGMSKQQVRDGLKVLKTQQLIKVENRGWRGKVMMHVTLTERGRMLALGEAACSPQHGPCSPQHNEWSIEHNGWSIEHGQDHHGESHGEIQIEAQGAAPPMEACATATEPVKGQAVDGVDQGMEAQGDMPKFSGSVADIVAQAQTTKPIAVSGDKASKLSLVYRQAWHEAYAEMGPALTLKEQGQLKMACKHWKPFEPGQVVRHTVLNWQTFTAKAASDAGAYNVPGKPTVPFLLKYAAIAGQLFAQASKAETVTKPNPVQVIAPEPEKSDKASLSEVLAIMSGDDDT